jgi:hypothetical protein
MWRRSRISHNVLRLKRSGWRQAERSESDDFASEREQAILANICD